MSNTDLNRSTSSTSSNDLDASVRSVKRRGLSSWFRRRQSGSGGSSGEDKRGRSSSPYSAKRFFSRSRSPSSERGIEKDEEDDDASGPSVTPETAFDDDATDSDEVSDDQEVLENTEANTGPNTVDEVLETLSPVHEQSELPNVIRRAFSGIGQRPTGQTSRRNSEAHPVELPLDISKPIYERNRCTIDISHGHPEAAASFAKRTRGYIVAFDYSEEASYAIEWAIGTVLRDGDECLIVSVIETDTKFDSDRLASTTSFEQQKVKNVNQRERYQRALLMQGIVTSLLERTRLHVRVSCQAIHAKNVRHLLVDMIDFFEPTMVIVGSRGLNKIKGMLLGSVSHYLVQKSSVPVMVARRRLRRAGKHRHKTDLDRGPRISGLAAAQIDKESHGSVVNEEDLAENEKEDGKPATDEESGGTSDQQGASRAQHASMSPEPV